MKHWILISLTALLTACATTPKMDVVIPGEDKKIVLNPEVYAKCDPLLSLPKLNDGSSIDWDLVLAITVSNFEIHADCVKKQNNSIAIIKKLTNVRE